MDPNVVQDCCLLHEDRVSHGLRVRSLELAYLANAGLAFALEPEDRVWRQLDGVRRRARKAVYVVNGGHARNVGVHEPRHGPAVVPETHAPHRPVNRDVQRAVDDLRAPVRIEGLGGVASAVQLPRQVGTELVHVRVFPGVLRVALERDVNAGGVQDTVDRSFGVRDVPDFPAVPVHRLSMLVRGRDSDRPLQRRGRRRVAGVREHHDLVRGHDLKLKAGGRWNEVVETLPQAHDLAIHLLFHGPEVTAVHHLGPHRGGLVGQVLVGDHAWRGVQDRDLIHGVPEQVHRHGRAAHVVDVVQAVLLFHPGQDLELPRPAQNVPTHPGVLPAGGVNFVVRDQHGGLRVGSDVARRGWCSWIEVDQGRCNATRPARASGARPSLAPCCVSSP